MEGKIKAIIKADLEAQAKVKEAELKIQNAIMAITKDKDAVHKEVFDRAQKFVADERKKLLDQLALSEKEGQKHFAQALHDLEERFSANQTKWLEELYQRSIRFEADNE